MEDTREYIPVDVVMTLLATPLRIMEGMSQSIEALVTLHTHTLADLKERLQAMSEVMGDVQEAISLLNNETNNLATRIQIIQRQIAEAPTVEEARAAASQITQVAGRLRQLAAVTSDVVPGGVVEPGQPLPDTEPSPQQG